jgi:hypothetical protein
MGKFHFFNKRRCSASAENRPIRCKEINENSQCNIIGQIKQLQAEAAVINAHIAATEMQCRQMPMVVTFLLSDAMSSVIQEIYLCQKRIYDTYERQTRVDTHAVNDLLRAVRGIPNIDEFCDELKTIYNNEIMLNDLKAQRTAISERISEFKTQLGIQ